MSRISTSTQGSGGFSAINSKAAFSAKFPAVTVVEYQLLPTVNLDEEAFECFMKYLNHPLDLEEKFIHLDIEKGNYFFFFTLLSYIASCAEGIYASEAAEIGENDNSATSLKIRIEDKITSR